MSYSRPSVSPSDHDIDNQIRTNGAFSQNPLVSSRTISNDEPCPAGASSRRRTQYHHTPHLAPAMYVKYTADVEPTCICKITLLGITNILIGITNENPQDRDFYSCEAYPLRPVVAISTVEM
jgi:hypothetical protein